MSYNLQNQMNLDKYEKIELKAVTKFLFNNEFSKEFIHNMLLKSFGSKTPSLRTVQRWTSKFNNGDWSIIPKKKSGRKSTRTAYINIVKEKVTEAKHLSVKDIAESLDISKSSIRRILKIDLGLRKLKLKWVPFSQNQNQQNQRMLISQKLLNLLSVPDKKWRIITGEL